MKLRRILLAISLCIISPLLLHAQEPKTPADLQKLAADYYNWRNQNYPVASSDAGLHTWDNKLTDYSLSAVLMRRLHVKEVLGKVRAMTRPKVEQRRSHRLAVVSRPTGRHRLLQSRDGFRRDRSADLRQRMQQRHLFAA